MKILITGGAGFIGTNLVAYLVKKGKKVRILDNLSREGTEKNLKWLKNLRGDLEVIIGDIQDEKKIRKAVKNVDIIYHLAAQVAVTSSVANPKEDFQVNALGTLNVLEAMRKFSPESVLIFSSTNKVYGETSNIKVIKSKKRYQYKDSEFAVTEDQPLDFYSPYGCSKGAADQYVRDYSRIYGLKTIVFRQSCIYGPHQFGNEDQGWVAHFAISALKKRKITIYGDGKQVRDILYIDDLAEAFWQAEKNIAKTKGKVYNIGGGRENSISLLEFISKLEKLTGKKISYSFADWRPGDQKIYISGIKRAKTGFGWEPVIKVDEGLKRLLNWVKKIL